MNLRPLAFVRLIAPLPLLILASFWRDPLIDLFEHLFTLSFVDRLILILSTAGARLCLCLLLALLAWGGAVLVRRSAWPGLMLIFLFLVWLVAGETLMPTRHGIFYWAVIAAAAMVNSLPAAPLRRALQRPVPRALLGLIFWGAIGFAEALAPRPYLIWLASRGQRSDRSAPPPLLAGLAPAWLAFFLVPFAPMARLEAQLFTSVEVRMVAGPDYAFNSPMDVTNPLFDPASGSLFYCGDGTDRVMKIADPQAASPPEATGIPTGGNQFCAIDAKAGHILAVDQQSGLVTLTRASDLVRLAERQLDPLPEGEIFVTLDPRHDHLLLSSEVTRPAPARPAIRVLTASSLAPVVTFDERPGAQTIDPESGAILFSSFRDRTGISAYDPLTGAPLARAESDARSDRLLVDEKRHRLIVTSPAASRLRLYDLPGLQPAGVLHSMLGGRSLVLDPVRDLLLVASLSGKVQVIDLGSGQILRQYRVGPWLRDMVLDPEAGIAYVASRFGIYRLNYLD